MNGIIDKLKNQVAQLTYHLEGQDWKEGGDLDKYGADSHAPMEWDKVVQYGKQAWNLSGIETYASYEQAQDSLRECLKLGYSAIERSIDVLEKQELRRNRRKKILEVSAVGAIIGFLVGVIFGPAILLAIMGAPMTTEVSLETQLVISLVGTAIGAFAGGLFRASRPTKGEEAIRNRYEYLKTELKYKYNSDL